MIHNSIIPAYRIVITTEQTAHGINGEIIQSALSEHFTRKETEVLERFLLALACEGVDVSDPRFSKAIDTTSDALFNAK